MDERPSRRQQYEERAARRSLERRIARALAGAWLSLSWERVWPALVPALAVAGLFCTVSWLGLWPHLNPWLRIALVVAFAAALLASLYPLTRLRLPARAEAVARVERASRLAHRPLSALRDTLSGDVSDEAQVLWQAHRNRTELTIGALESGAPQPRMAARDPYALRAIVLMAFLVAGVYAGNDRMARIGQAFLSPQAQITAATRLDAWVSPPSYTGRPPVLLTGDVARSDTVIAVPSGSRLIVRSEDADSVSLGWQPDRGETVELPAQISGTDSRLAEIDFDLTTTGMAEVRRGGSQVALWRFEIIADTAPSISLSREPEALASGALRMVYDVADDYGVVSAHARIAVADPQAAARPLVPAPQFPLTLPQLRARSGSAQTVKDLTAHPWAGAEVVITLEAKDDAGQSGLSEPVRFMLPARSFREPLARALVEQRRSLALNRSAQGEVRRALELLALAPDTFDVPPQVYLGLRSASFRLRNAHNDDDLRSVIDLLWEIALSVEDGDLADVARDLRAAQQALQQALENGASDQEIAKLVEELRNALNKFMQELARRMQDPANLAELPNMENLRTVTPQDLDRMLDSIENMARSGARDQAQQLLSELRNMLENLQSGQSGQSAEQQQMSQTLEELADIIRRQQEVMDQTFRLDQQGPMAPGGERGQPGEQRAGEAAPDGGQAELEGLERAQRELRDQLGEMLRRLGQSGHEGSEQMGRAGEAMGNAQGALGQGETGEAVQNQSRALEALRDGARQLADQLARSMGMDGGIGEARRDTDPMGRPNRTQGPDLGNSIQVPDEIDAARARQILEELRRRLSDTERPRIERDYLERLLGR